MARYHVARTAVITDVASAKQYIKEIKKSPGLSKGQEAELATLAQAGDTAARNKLVEANLRFAIQVANQYKGTGLLQEDLIGFATLGLFEAVERFDVSKNVKFVTFAVWYIRAELQKAIQDLSRVVRVPSHKNMTEKQSIVSTQSPVGDDDNKETFADRFLADEATVSKRDIQDLRFDLDRALSQLNAKQREALVRNYGIGFEYAQSMEQIGEAMGITNERARQLVRQAETALAEVPGIKLLEQYL